MDRNEFRKTASSFAGLNKWQIASDDDGILTTADGPHGLRVEESDTLGFPVSRKAVAYPAACASACSFDKELLQETGESLARDCIEAGVGMLLGPGVNHKRDPLCGRNFEYFSEDPVLSGELAAAYIKGLQKNGVSACIKHFAGNNREYLRNTYDSVIDERTLREIYLRQFEIAVKKSHPWAIMTAYNRLNGNYCAENRELMDTARSWGFDGAFISDWGGVSDPVASVRSGLNVMMPGGNTGIEERVEKAYEKGLVTEARINEESTCMRQLIARTSAPLKKTEYDLSFQHDIALKAACESIVLAKNDGILPLRENETVALIGTNAKTPYSQGLGSSRVNAHYEHTLFDCLRSRHTSFYYADENDGAYACAIAAKADKVIFITGQKEKESETYDRRDMKLDAQVNALISRLSTINPDMIVIVQSGSPVEMPWLDQVKAVLLPYLSGSMGARALDMILYGDVCPSGRLAETWPLRYEDTPLFTQDRQAPVIPYTEMLCTGYRWYDTLDIPAAFPFGHGLSYTSFEWSDLKCTVTDSGIDVSLKVKNTGSCRGRDVVQIYVSMPQSRIFRPKKELKDFGSIELEPGEEDRLHFLLDHDRLSFFDTQRHAWTLEEGDLTVMAGASVCDIRLQETVHVTGEKEVFSSVYRPDQETLHDLHLFEKAYGKQVPAQMKQGMFDADSVLMDFAHTASGRLAMKMIDYIFDHTDIVEGIDREVIYTTPIRQMVMVSDRLTWDTVDGITDILNGRVFAGIRKVLADIHRNRKR